MAETEKANRARPARQKLGDSLVEAGLIDEKTLKSALEIQKIKKKRIGQVLVDMGVTTDLEIAQALSRQLKIPFLRLQDVTIPAHVLSLIPGKMAESYQLIPVRAVEKKLVIAVANPLELYDIDDIQFLTNMSIEIAVAPQEDILRAIRRSYPKEELSVGLDPSSDFDEAVEVVSQMEEQLDEKAVSDIINLAKLPPVMRLSNSIIAEAIELKASDIHIEPHKSSVGIRYRVDGIIREMMQTDKHVHAPLVSRLKVLSCMDISIRNRPQDGRLQVKFGDLFYDLRVSTLPTAFGEKMTIRILDPSSAERCFEELGFPETGVDVFENILYQPQGIILVTGPTGSGKTSTLYACLSKVNTPSVNIITVEDPIEFKVKGINQVQINPKAGLTFASGLRSILRQDPDIVMVGEIRDKETATIAFQAAQTGHMVLSTLHTNDAPSAVTRLFDLGVDAFLISGVLSTVIGQRLVRKICQECKTQGAPDANCLNRIPGRWRPADDSKLWKGVGCKMCLYSGFAGRIGIFEMLLNTPELGEVIRPNTPAGVIRAAAEKAGFLPMIADGIRKAGQGLTTLDEVIRVVPSEVNSANAKTATFNPYRPQAERKQPQPEPSVLTSSQEESPKKIVLVEDNRMSMKILLKVLESRNYAVRTATDGMDAMTLISREKPDLVITDYIMPKMDGIELTQELRSSDVTRNIPIMMLTVQGTVDAEIDGITAGADDYLTKPVNARRLLARVGRLLSRTQIQGH